FLGLISIFLGIWVAGHVSGKLRSTVIFLILAVTVFIIKEVLKIFGFITLNNLEFLRSISNIIVILLILFAIFSLKIMVDSIVHKPLKKKRKDLGSYKRKVREKLKER
ncbi:unnamed protein product, partial [marine sediment metagenome]